jgi:hypothetical protein
MGLENRRAPNISMDFNFLMGLSRREMKIDGLLIIRWLLFFTRDCPVGTKYL